MTTQLLRRRPSLFSRLGESVLAVIGPRSGLVPETFANPCPNAQLYEEMVHEIQRFRGSIYLEDGTIPASALDAQGRHRTPLDYNSWHFVLMNQGTRIAGCMRATLHTSSSPVSNLKLHEVISRMSDEQGKRYGAAVQSFLGEAFESSCNVIEAGGWAVRKELRNSRIAPVLALACWSLGRLLGNSRMIGFAGRCNHSAEILRRLGGFPLTYHGAELGAFYDEHHQCEGEFLGFDCWQVPEVYEQTVEDIKDYLQKALITVPSGSPTVYPARCLCRESA
jgi:hypothetical protein